MEKWKKELGINKYVEAVLMDLLKLSIIFQTNPLRKMDAYGFSENALIFIFF